MKLSVVLPVYNVAPYLEKALESLCNQKSEEVEFIFVNDGSTDDSLNIMKKWEKKDKRITIIDKENEGSGMSRNRGMDVSQGEYIYFMDPDDWVQDNFIERILNVLSDNQPQVIAFGYNVYNGNQLSKVIRSPHKFEILENKLSTESFDKIFNTISLFEVWNKVYNKKFLETENLRFNSFRNGQDAYFNIDMAKKLQHILVLDEVFYNYYASREGSAQNSYYSYEKFSNSIQIAKNYDSLYDLYKSKGDQPHVYWLSIFFTSIPQNIKENISPIWESQLYETKVRNLKLNDISSNKRKLKLLLMKYTPRFIFKYI